MSKPFGTETADFFTVYDDGEFIALYVHLQKVPFTLGQRVGKRLGFGFLQLLQLRRIHRAFPPRIAHFQIHEAGFLILQNHFRQTDTSIEKVTRMDRFQIQIRKV